MKLTNQSIIVEFQTSHNRVLGKGLNGIDIIRPTVWQNKEAEEDENSNTRYDENTNHLETNPQIARVLHSNVKYPYQEGDMVFLHYMAWETAEYTEYGAVTEADFVFFKINEDGTFVMRDKHYLGKAVYSAEKTTASGIILLAGEKDNLRVKLTHVPARPVCSVGDTVVSIDKNNYEFDYWGEKYVLLKEEEIIAVCMEEKADAVGNE